MTENVRDRVGIFLGFLSQDVSDAGGVVWVLGRRRELWGEDEGEIVDEVCRLNPLAWMIQQKVEKGIFRHWEFGDVGLDYESHRAIYDAIYLRDGYDVNLRAKVMSVCGLSVEEDVLG